MLKGHVNFFLLLDCWQQDPHKRPSFQGILEDLEEMSDSSFAQDDQNSFRTLQEGWQTEIEQIFDELREKEKVTSFYSVFCVLPAVESQFLLLLLLTIYLIFVFLSCFVKFDQQSVISDFDLYTVKAVILALRHTNTSLHV